MKTNRTITIVMYAQDDACTWPEKLEEELEQGPGPEVVLRCDHGQTLMKASVQGVDYIEGWSQHLLEEVEEGTKVYVLEALLSP